MTFEFSKPRSGSAGYDKAQVDAFLARVRATESGEDDLTPADIEDVRFGRSPVGRGYRESEVDDLLDRAAAAIAAIPRQSDTSPLTAEEIRATRFPPVPEGRRGYTASEVDALLTRAAATLDGADTLTADDIRHAAFGAPPPGGLGYHEVAVDVFLDRLESTLDSP
ncbi:DivIVA domain-containing protein [Actinokineospora guangxiensis]|uniref:Cell wall synthesis protein Wag31 n=1 Tax=Actinokineospora guangxiensis TaxID=1490288 RepID=A0ABW0EMI2_9PSEU